MNPQIEIEHNINTLIARLDDVVATLKRISGDATKIKANRDTPIGLVTEAIIGSLNARIVETQDYLQNYCEQLRKEQTTDTPPQFTATEKQAYLDRFTTLEKAWQRLAEPPQQFLTREYPEPGARPAVYVRRFNPGYWSDNPDDDHRAQRQGYRLVRLLGNLQLPNNHDHLDMIEDWTYWACLGDEAVWIRGNNPNPDGDRLHLVVENNDREEVSPSSETYQAVLRGIRRAMNNLYRPDPHLRKEQT